MTVQPVQVLTGEILAPADGMVRVVIRPNPLRDEVREMDLPAGLSIAEMLNLVLADAPARRHVCNVYLAGEAIPKDMHARVRPKPGTTLVVRAWFRGSIGRAIATIALMAVAMWAGGPAGLALISGATGLTITGTAATLVGGAIMAGVSMVGSLLINAIAPPPTPGRDALGARDRQELLPGIRGSQNRADPYGAIPLVLGRHLVVPLFGAEPFPESVGDDQYLRMLLVVGYGPLKITDIKIGDTPISEYDDVEVEVREGWPTDKPMRLYPSTVFTESLSLDLTNEAGWTSRTTADDSDEAIVDTVAPQGIGFLSKKGKWKEITVHVAVQYRRVGMASWFPAGTITYEEHLPRTKRRAHRVKFAVRGQYQIRVKRISPDQPEDSEKTILDKIVWEALRSVRNDEPINSPVPLAKIAVRIKATDQLNGVIDNLSCIATSIVRDWNGSAWVATPTRNAAAIYRHALTGPHLKKSVAAPRLDDTEIRAWHADCVANGWYCDAVIQSQRTLFDVLKDIASTGRASFQMKDGLYSVKRDRPQTVPVQMLTRRNIISIRGQRVFPDPPHAIRVQFVSAAAGYQMDEIIVYADGYSAANAQIFESLDLWGITDLSQAVKMTRYHMAVAKLRPETLTVQMDMEHLVATPGKLVRVAHDVMLVGLATGRITKVNFDGSGAATSVEVDEPCVTELSKNYAIAIRRASEFTPEVTRSVGNNNPGPKTLLVFNPPITSGQGRPSVGDLFAFGEEARVTEDWIVKSVEPEEGWRATLTLVPHAPAVHDADQGPIPDYRPRTTLPIWMRDPPAPVFASVETGDSALERLPNGDLKPRIVASIRIPEGWQYPTVARINAQVKRGRYWTDDGVTIEGLNRIVIRDVESGERYDVRAQTVSDFGRLSRWVVQPAISVVGAEERPRFLDGLSIEIRGATTTLRWPEPPDIDVDFYLVRHSTATSGANWANAISLRRVPAPATSVEVPTKIGTYMVKLVDHQGQTSAIAATVTTTIPRVAGLNFVVDADAHPAFLGTRDNILVDGDLDGIRLASVDGEEFFVEVQNGIPVEVQDGVPLVIQATLRSFFAAGTWTMNSDDAIDLGGVFTSRVSANLGVVAVDLVDSVLDWPDVLSMDDIFGGAHEFVTVRAFVATTNTAVNGSEVWSDWKEFVAGDFTARGYKFKLQLESTQEGVTPVVTSATFVVDMPDRVYSKSASIASGGTTVPFTPPFFAVPEVGITIRGGASGDRLSHTISRTGVAIQILNSGGTGVARTVDILARAYGEEE